MNRIIILLIFSHFFSNGISAQDILDKYTSTKWGFTISFPFEKTKKGSRFEDDKTFQFHISQYYRGQYDVVDISVIKYSDTLELVNNYNSMITALETSKLSDGYTLIDSLCSEVKSAHYNGVQKAFYNEFAGLNKDYIIVRFFKTDRYLYSLTLTVPNLKRYNENLKILASFTILTQDNQTGAPKKERKRPK